MTTPPSGDPRSEGRTVSRRKAEHLRIALDSAMPANGLTTGFEHFQFVHQALPEIDLVDVNVSLLFLGKTLAAPLFISPMTGGTRQAGPMNRNLAEAAQHLGVAMGVGSQRAALNDLRLAASYRVRNLAPDILLFANLGAVQLNNGFSVDECRRAVEMVQADALILHLNPLQEALQADGNTNFRGLRDKIAAICRRLDVPVVVKEVGWGLSADTARQLAEAGVAALDVAGAGGTSWSEVERRRALSPARERLAAAFMHWGIPTARSLQEVRAAVPFLPMIASGGVRSGIDVAKAIALGADLVGVAAPLLTPATQSAQAVADVLSAVIAELRVAMFCIGAGNLAALRRTPHLQRLEPDRW